MSQEADYNKAVQDDQRETQYVFNCLASANEEGVLMEVMQEFIHNIRAGPTTLTRAIDEACWEWDV